MTLSIQIYRPDTPTDWSLEVVLAAGTSMIWEDLFPTDTQAKADFLFTVTDEEVAAFLAGKTILPFRLWERLDLLPEYRRQTLQVAADCSS